MIRIFAVTLATFGLLALPAYAAEDMPDIPKPLKVMPTKIKPVQTSTDELSKAAPDTQTGNAAVDGNHLETLTPRANAGFSADFWANSTRADMAAFLSLPSGISANRTLHDLALRAILTPAPALSAEGSDHDNLYALRLQRLINLGDYGDALALYKMNEDDPPSPLAARAGIESLLGHGDIAVACLEQKAISPTLKTDTPDFWAHIDTFCQALLSPVAGNDNDLRLGNAARIYLETLKIAPPATMVEVNSLDTITTIAMVRSGKLATLLSQTAHIGELSDSRIGLLLAFIPPTATARLPVLAEALKRGIASDSAAIGDLAKIDLTDKTNAYIPFLKEYLKQAPPILTSSLLDLANTTDKDYLLLPLYAADEVAFPETKKLTSLRLLAAANQPLPANLVRKSFPTTESMGLNPSESGELALITLLQNDASPEKKAVLMALKPFFTAENQQNDVYDNILNLTGLSNYVMPTGDILSNLKKSADKKQMDQVVIKSLALLSATPLDHLHPAAVYRILEALNSAGLKEETTSLARHVLGTLLEK